MENEAAASPAPAAPASEGRGVWSTLREAVRGSSQDFTQGSIGCAIFMLAVPMVFEMAMESIFAVVDVFFVSRLGPEAVATVGITEAMITLVYAIAMGLSISAAAMVSRRIGEKKPEAASVAAVQAIALGIATAVPLAALGLFLAPGLLGIMGADERVVAIGSGYTSVMFGGCVTVLLLFLINAIFRGSGDPAIAMRVLWLANGINIVLDPCLIFGLGPFPELGVTGAAVATTTGRGIGVLLQIWILARGQGRVSVLRHHLRLEPAIMLRLIRISLNGMFQILVGTASWLGLIRILTGFGSAAVAGYTIGIRIIIFAILPSWGMSNAAATMVGQNLGAGKPERAEKAVWLAGFYNMFFLGGIGLVFVTLAGPVIGLFTTDPEVLPFGIACLRFVSCGFLFYAYGMVVVQAFNGAGDTFTPTLINLFCFWLWEIPLAYFLAHIAGFGPSGVFAAITVAFSTVAVVGSCLFKRGRWKQVRV